MDMVRVYATLHHETSSSLRLGELNRSLNENRGKAFPGLTSYAAGRACIRSMKKLRNSDPKRSRPAQSPLADMDSPCVALSSEPSCGESTSCRLDPEHRKAKSNHGCFTKAPDHNTMRTSVCVFRMQGFHLSEEAPSVRRPQEF